MKESPMITGTRHVEETALESFPDELATAYRQLA
jgi:hypothetical protein